MSGELICGDCYDSLVEQPARSAALVIGSPPYAFKGKRYQGTTAKPWPIHDWIEWMADITVAAINVTTNVVVWVVNGTVKDGAYQPAVEGLVWRMYQEGVICERPAIWHKNAPPNRMDWFGNDWEFCIAFRPHDSTRYFNWEAIGTPPKYANGGQFRQRGQDGKRRLGGAYPKGKITRPRDVIAPLRTLSIPCILAYYACTTKTDPASVLRDLQLAADAEDLLRWWSGIAARVLQEAFLQQGVQGPVTIEGQSGQRDKGERAETGKEQAEARDASGQVRNVQPYQPTAGASSRRKPKQQRDQQSPGPVPVVPPESPQECYLLFAGVREAVQRSGILQHALPEIQKVRDAVDEMLWQGEAKAISDLIRVTVGGGHLGSKLSFLNEAPFPEKLIEPFILALTKPGETVIDPFCGSGTTCAVAQRLGRAYIGIDNRQDQIDLTKQRLAEFMPTATHNDNPAPVCPKCLRAYPSGDDHQCKAKGNAKKTPAKA